VAMGMVRARGRRSGEGGRRGSRLWPCTGRGRRTTTNLVSSTLTTRSSLGLSVTYSRGISSGKGAHCLAPSFFHVFIFHFNLPRCHSFACVWLILFQHVCGPLLHEASNLFARMDKN
jgi:hypothetical protein